MRYNINTKETYTKNGEEKTIWNQVGTLQVNDDGKMFLKLNMFPDTKFFVFEQKPKDTPQW